MADRPLGPILPANMLGKAPDFTIPKEQAPNPLGQALQGYLGMLGQQQVQQAQASQDLAFTGLDELMNLLAEYENEIASWVAPLEGTSRALGAAVQGESPFRWGEGGIHGPMLSEALREAGAPEWASLLSEFLVPDPFGAGKVTDLVPLFAALPFLRSVRNSPETMARVVQRIEMPGGSGGLMDDLRSIFNATDAEHPRYGEQGVMLSIGNRSDGMAQVQVSMIDDSTARVDNLISTFDEGGRGELRQLLPLLDVADANGVTLVASPEPFGHKRSDLNALYRQYGQMGFEVDPDDPTRMIRRPLPFDDAQRKTEAAARMERNSQVLSQPRGFENVTFDGELDMLMRQEMGITLEDWVAGTEQIGDHWGREMLEQLSIPESSVDDLMTSWRMGSRPGQPGGAIVFPLTELGQPQAPTRSSFAQLASADSPSAAAWLRAWGVDEAAATDMVFLSTYGDNEEFMRMAHEAFATIDDPAVANELMSIFDPSVPVDRVRSPLSDRDAGALHRNPNPGRGWAD